MEKKVTEMSSISIISDFESLLRHPVDCTQRCEEAPTLSPKLDPARGGIPQSDQIRLYTAESGPKQPALAASPPPPLFRQLLSGISASGPVSGQEAPSQESRHQLLFLQASRRNGKLSQQKKIQIEQLLGSRKRFAFTS